MTSLPRIHGGRRDEWRQKQKKKRKEQINSFCSIGYAESVIKPYDEADE